MQGDPIRIPLYGRDGTIRAHALIDREDGHLAALRWHMDGDGYAMHSERLSKARTTKQGLHRAVVGLGCGDPRHVDHIDGNRLDCRRANLRCATPAQNGQNVVPPRGGTSPYRGVHWNKAATKWEAGARLNGRRVYLGVFASELEAAAVAKAWRLAHMPFTNEERAA